MKVDFLIYHQIFLVNIKIKVSDPPNPSNLEVVHLNPQGMAREFGVGVKRLEAREIIAVGKENTSESTTDLDSSIPMITNPIVLFVEEILVRMAMQVPELQKILVQDVSKPKIDDLPMERRKMLRQKLGARVLDTMSQD